MKNTELMNKAKISRSTLYKIKNGEDVTTDVLLKGYVMYWNVLKNEYKSDILIS